jgi:cyclophilin family peptidyl-prolyl cis-trans isomerase
MNKFLSLIAVLLLAVHPAPALAQDAPAVGVVETAPTGPRVLLRTSMGDITIALDSERAPATVQNFLGYASEGFYNGTVFHRVIENMLVQGGAYTPDLQIKPTRAPIANESEFTLSNLRGTVAAARATGDADSHTTQFFINVVDNPRFDFRGAGDPYTQGYAVFGRVVSGMDVVDRIRAVETGERGPLPRNVPITPVIIERVEILEGSGPGDAG